MMRYREGGFQLGSFFRQQLVVLLVFWLTVAAPMTCEYHGLLLFDAPTMHAMLHLEQADHHGSVQADGHQLHNHEMATSVTLLQSLFLMALPAALIVQLPEQGRTFGLPDPTPPAEWVLPPPDQPPRSSGLNSAV